MKITATISSRFLKGLVALVLTTGIGHFAGVQLCAQTPLTLYFDRANGGESSVVNNGLYDWNANTWNPTAAGTGNIEGWTPGSIAVFSAGADAAPHSYTVRPNTAITVAGITVQEGAVTISANGGTLSLSQNAVFQVAAATPPTNLSTLNLNMNLQGTSNLEKTGAGIMTMNAANTYSGTTTVSGGSLVLGSGGSILNSTGVTVNTGGTLLLQGTGAQISDTAAVNLNGGTIRLGANGIDEQVGVLTLSGSSVIDFGNFSSATFRFADSELASWTGTLSVWNWTAGSDRLFFGSVEGQGVPNLNQIVFYSDNGETSLGNPQYLPDGEVSPIPEPSAVLVGLSLLSLAGFRERRWFLRCREAKGKAES